MADADVVQNLTEAVENATEAITGKKVPSTPEGMLVAYSSLVVMAMLPIFFGSMRSVSHQKHQKVNSKFSKSYRNEVRSVNIVVVGPITFVYVYTVDYYQ